MKKIFNNGLTRVIFVELAVLLFCIPSVASATTIGNTITVTNDANISGNVTSTNVTSSGYMDIGGKLGSSNASYGNGDLNVGNQLAVDGSAYVSSTLHVTGNSRFFGTLTVDGAFTGSNSVSSTIVTSSRHIGIGQIDSSNANWAGGSLNVGNRLSVDGAVYVSSTMDVTDNVRLYGNLTVLGTVSTTNATTTGYLVVGQSGYLNSIGAASYNPGDLNVHGNVGIGNNLLLAGNATFGTTTAQTVNLISRLSSSLTPSLNNNGLIGDVGFAWGDMYSSGTLRVATTTVSNQTSSTLYIRSRLDGTGGRIYLEDVDGAGCTVVSAINGVLHAAIEACPLDD